MKKRFLWIMVAAGLLLLAGCGKKNTDGMSVSDTEAAEMEALDFDASDYVKLGDYKKLPVKYPVPTVTDEDVQSSISDLIDENTEYDQVERAILNGDYVSIDFTGTIDGKEFEGVFRLNEPSVHGSDTPKISKRNFDEMEVVIDELVESDEDVKKLGINPGDFIALDSRFRYSNGFVKSRHLDDKASSGVLLALAKEIKEENLKFDRNIYMMFTTYEEVGHGASSGHPSGIKDMIAVDMGVVFDDLKTNDRLVSICAKDSSGPYNFDLTNDLINTAKKIGIDFAIDIYPFYGSDASAAMSSFYDYRHALVGCGISASHGYERCHENALMNLFDLLKTYILK